MRLPAFGRLLAAYTLNELAWSVGTLALAVLVYRRTGSALGSTGFFLCSQVVPGFVAPSLVARLDRFSPRVILPLLYWLEAVLFGVLAWMTHRFELAPVLVLTLADGVVAITARSLASAARAEILKPVDLLPEGNAVTNTAFSICFMAGPLIGGAVVVAGGTVAALIANCALFAVMGVVLLSDALPGAMEKPGPSRGRLRAALAHARCDRPLGALLILQGVGLVFFTISIPVEVIYAQHTLHAGPGGYGALLAAWGGGAIIGSIAYARWRRRSSRLLLTGSSLAVALGFGVMTVAPSLPLALVGAAIGGVANGIASTAFRTEIQDRTPQAWMALITALNQSIGQVTPGLGILIGGGIAAVASPRAAFAVAGVGSLLYAFAIAVELAPSRMGPVPPVEMGPSPKPESPVAEHKTLA
jgi:predicted MFS family arabinose efflux permease